MGFLCHIQPVDFQNVLPWVFLLAVWVYIAMAVLQFWFEDS